MSYHEDGGPAFPHDEFIVGSRGISAETGMSLRDYFAAKAMQGMAANPELMAVVTAGDIRDGSAIERLARKSYEVADAMLKARAQ